MTGYLRGQVAKIANVNMETLRYYEKQGLLPPLQRSESGYRIYSEEVLDRLTFIHNAKTCGFTLKEIRKALTKSRNSEININDFIMTIDRKQEKIRSEISKKEDTLLALTQLKSNLQATDRHPGVQATLQILNMDS
ncbi:MerR family transcriptional regulator [Paenibacillus sp. GCM10012306]|uniref:MerR family transcriptional regulator n=1 Tax=Paenibacillus sp. GCM10012306 TaxID=3317342 RepID=UPI00360BA723